MRPKLFFRVLLDWGMEKTIVIFGISTLQLAEMQNIVQNKQIKQMDQKCLIWVFYTYCHISSILKLKIHNFGTKHVWFRCFQTTILKNNYCHIWNQQSLFCHLGDFYQYSEFYPMSAFSSGPLFPKVRFIKYDIRWLTLEAYLEPNQTSTTELFIENS